MKNLLLLPILALTLTVSSCGKNKDHKVTNKNESKTDPVKKPPMEAELFAFSQEDLIETTKNEDERDRFRREFTLKASLSKEVLNKLKFISFYGDKDADFQDVDEFEIYFQSTTRSGAYIAFTLMEPKKNSLDDVDAFNFKIDTKEIKKWANNIEDTDLKIIILGSVKESESESKIRFAVTIPLK